MRTITGYQLDEQLYESATSTVYRGRRAVDALAVILQTAQTRLSAAPDHRLVQARV